MGTIVGELGEPESVRALVTLLSLCQRSAESPLIGPNPAIWASHWPRQGHSCRVTGVLGHRPLVRSGPGCFVQIHKYLGKILDFFLVTSERLSVNLKLNDLFSSSRVQCEDVRSVKISRT